MSTESFASVWDALEEAPTAATNLRLRSTLTMALEQHIRSQGWSLIEAADRTGMTQARVSELLRGEIDRFALNTLINIVVAVGLHIEMQVREA